MYLHAIFKNLVFDVGRNIFSYKYRNRAIEAKTVQTNVKTLVVNAVSKVETISLILF